MNTCGEVKMANSVLLIQLTKFPNVVKNTVEYGVVFVCEPWLTLYLYQLDNSVSIIS